MADRMSSTLRQLIRERKLLKIAPKREMVLKEIEGAQSDLKDAQDSLEHKKFKWATIQGYYSMFHSARALLYNRGFREKSHYALSIAIRELFMNQLGRELLNQFEDGMELRQEHPLEMFVEQLANSLRKKYKEFTGIGAGSEPVIQRFVFRKQVSTRITRWAFHFLCLCLTSSLTDEKFLFIASRCSMPSSSFLRIFTTISGSLKTKRSHELILYLRFFLAFIFIHTINTRRLIKELHCKCFQPYNS